jgi:hypothetical protein
MGMVGQRLETATGELISLNAAPRNVGQSLARPRAAVPPWGVVLSPKRAYIFALRGRSN